MYTARACDQEEEFMPHLPVNGTHLHYEISGSGPVLIFIQNFGVENFGVGVKCRSKLLRHFTPTPKFSNCINTKQLPSCIHTAIRELESGIIPRAFDNRSSEV